MFQPLFVLFLFQISELTEDCEADKGSEDEVFSSNEGKAINYDENQI